MKYLGKHSIIELYGCPADLLAQPDSMERILKATALAMGATIIESKFHHFSPLGVSGVVIIAESHLTIHTWPEHEYAAVDMFTCGSVDFEKGIQYLKEHLKSNKIEWKVLDRGKI